MPLPTIYAAPLDGSCAEPLDLFLYHYM